MYVYMSIQSVFFDKSRTDRSISNQMFSEACNAHFHICKATLLIFVLQGYTVFILFRIKIQKIKDKIYNMKYKKNTRAH
jgi:hypothetical protein